MKDSGYVSIEKYTKDIGKLSMKLAAAEAALKIIADLKNWGSDGGWVGESHPDEIACAALVRK